MNRTPHCRCGERDPARYYPGHGFGTCKTCKSRRVAARARAKRAGIVSVATNRAAMPLTRNDLIMEWIGAVK